MRWRMFFVAVLFSHVLGVHLWHLKMQPQVTSLPPNANETVDIICRPDTTPLPFVACGFQIGEYNEYYDLNAGVEAPPSSGDGYTARYQGAGLKMGECGVRITQTDSMFYRNIGCRARTEKGRWVYAYGTIGSEKYLPYTLTPRDQVALPGGNLDLLLHAAEPLATCRIRPTKRDRYLEFDQGPRSRDVSYHNQYHGAGLPEGDCGIHVTLVSGEGDNGWFRFDVRTRDENTEGGMAAFAVTSVAIAKPPLLAPVMQVSRTDFEEDEILEARCSVEASRPPANITWYLGGFAIAKHDVEDIPESRWRWNHEEEIRTQTVKIPLTFEDDGEELRCVARHYGTKTRLQASATIRVKRVPVCGMRHVNPGLIAGGHEAEEGEFPWHAGLYELIAGNHQQVCGGTLISTNVVITAAHCVYNERYRRVQPATNYRMVLGKLQRDYYADLDIAAVQRFDVASIHTRRQFIGRRADYRYDIAVLKLATHAVLTDSVNIACVDLENRFNEVQLATGNSGTVAGWGLTTTGATSATTLQWVDLPWVNLDTCFNATAIEVQKYITNDKFCAGYVDQATSVCPGDSGGGLLFLNATTQRHYLRGVVSTNLVRDRKPTDCNSNLYTSFTMVADYVDWIKTLL